jgi:hypothetical protein
MKTTTAAAQMNKGQNIQSVLSASKRLNYSVRALFSVGLIGQLAFAVYILLFYGGSALMGNWDSWTEAMIHGFLEGDFWGNTALLMHIFLAFFITAGGPLQFVKVLREKGSTFHKWNGRIYILTALIISIGALYMVWAREATVGGQLGRIAISLNALLIILFGILTWRTALHKKFVAHRKWAIRTFIVVSGVWFFRIGFGTWFLLTNFNAYGVTSDLTGPFDQFLYFGSYLVPLAIVEAYLFVKESNKALLKNMLAAFLFVLTLVLIGGTAITAKIFWLDSILA